MLQDPGVLGEYHVVLQRANLRKWRRSGVLCWRLNLGVR